MARSAAQKAATKKLVAFNKKRKAAPKRKAGPKKKAKSTNKATKPKRTMAGKRRTRIVRRSRSVGRGIGSSFKTGVIGDVVKGLGAGSLVTLVMSRVAPNSSLTPLVATGAGFVTGGLVGGAANLVLSGGLSQLGGIFGGGVSAPMSEVSV